MIIKNKGIKNNDTCSILGLTIIIFSIVLYNKDIPYPSFYALPPVVGTILIILYAGKTSLISKILSNRFIVGIGLISYSAYLWHQPIFSFANIRLLEEPSTLLMLSLSIFSLFLGYISWRWIEIPFRSNKFEFKTIYLIVLPILCLFIFIYFGLMGHKTNGFENRKAAGHLPDDFYKYATLDKVNSSCIDSKKPCNLSDKKNTKDSILLIGDSHSVDFHFDFIEMSTEIDLSPYQFSIGGCGFFLIQFKNCKEKTELLKKIVQDKSYKKIILVNDLYGHASKKIVNNVNWEEYQELISVLTANTEKLFIFMPRFHLSSTKTLNNIIYQNYNLNKIKMLGSEDLVNKFYQKIGKIYKNLYFYNQTEEIIKLDGNFKSFRAITSDGYPIYKDTNHITPYATKSIFKDFMKNEL